MQIYQINLFQILFNNYFFYSGFFLIFILFPRLKPGAIDNYPSLFASSSSLFAFHRYRFNFDQRSQRQITDSKS